MIVIAVQDSTYFTANTNADHAAAPIGRDKAPHKYRK